MRKYNIAYKGNIDQFSMLSIRKIGIILTISLSFVIGSVVYLNRYFIKAYAEIALSNDNVAKSIQVRVKQIDTNVETRHFRYKWPAF